MLRVINRSLFVILLLIFTSCIVDHEKDNSNDYSNIFISIFDYIDNKFGSYVEIEKKDSLVVYYPKYSYIDLVCDERPLVDEDSVIMVVAAAITLKKESDFSHTNIAGDHISGGKKDLGTPCTLNTGAFAYYNNQWTFLYYYYRHEFNNAERFNGAAFGQETIIYNFAHYARQRQVVGRDIQRALCELNGRLCIIESINLQTFEEFQKKISDLKVRHALALDMQPSCRYSWYRTSNGTVKMFPKEKNSNHCTNWLVFYK